MQVKQDFLVRLEDTGKGFVLSNKGFLIMLTNLACIHGTRIGQGLMDREKCHLSWMVVGWRLVVDHRPLLCETVHGTTWASGYGRLQTTRDFVLHDQQGQAAAKATSSWLVLDEHNTRVLRMTPEIVEPYGLETDQQTFPGYAFPREAPAFTPERTGSSDLPRLRLPPGGPRLHPGAHRVGPGEPGHDRLQRPRPQHRLHGPVQRGPA